jgi:DNA-nicking Smr family endonuclease
MKRSSTSIPEMPGSPRRKRSLSEEERALWEHVAKQLKPLRKKSHGTKVQVESPGVGSATAVKPVALPKPQASVKISRAPKPEAPPLAPIGRRDRSQLSRGRKEIDARLDLHGMTQMRAHHALFSFLQRAHGDGLTFVLVITGKGRMGAESERGVLRRQVPQWLGLP